MEKIYEIQSLDNRCVAFSFLSELQCHMIHCKEDTIILDFRKCKFSHAVFTSFIGALTEIGKAFQKQVRYRFKVDSRIYSYFKKSGMYDYMVNEGKHIHTNQNALPFWKVKMDEELLMSYIDSIIDLSKIRIIDKARQQLFRNFYELFVNARDHSDEKYGVYSCGHWMPRQKCLIFSIYDTGIGIPQLVKNRVDSNLSDIEALEWAMVGGNSTRQLEKGVPRGLGLSDLKKFVELNNGRLSILSNGVFYDYGHRAKNNTEQFEYANMGTLICVTIYQDSEHVYI